MNRALTRVPASLRERARSAERRGIAGPLWCLADALQVLDALDGTNVVVLGGDVFREGDTGDPAPVYDNWFCEREGPQEPLELYASRSRMLAREYVTSYAQSHDSLFRLVLTDEATAGLHSL